MYKLLQVLNVFPVWIYIYREKNVVTYENTGGGGQLQLLDSGRIHHNPHPLAHGLWWQVLGELCSDRPSVAMRSGHLAPNDSKVGLLRLWLSGDRSLVLGLQKGKNNMSNFSFTESIGTLFKQMDETPAGLTLLIRQTERENIIANFFLSSS